MEKNFQGWNLFSVTFPLDGGDAVFFKLNETGAELTAKLATQWNRGGFPDSYLARNDKGSRVWRENFIRTFLERDIPQMGFNIPAMTLQRLWSMLAHLHGQLLNESQAGPIKDMDRRTC